MKLTVGRTYNALYRLEDKVQVNRIITVVRETEDCYLVNTGPLRSTPIKKDDIISKDNLQLHNN